MTAINADSSNPQSMGFFVVQKMPIQPVAVRANAALYRISAAAGRGSASILQVNAAKRIGLIATTNLTQILAPTAEIVAGGSAGGCADGQLAVVPVQHPRFRCDAYIGKAVPQLALDLGLVPLAGGIAWLAGWLWVQTTPLAQA